MFCNASFVASGVEAIFTLCLEVQDTNNFSSSNYICYIYIYVYIYIYIYAMEGRGVLASDLKKSHKQFMP